MMSCGKVADKEFGDPIVLDLTKDPVDMKLSDFVERVSHIYLEKYQRGSNWQYR